VAKFTSIEIERTDFQREKVLLSNPSRYDSKTKLLQIATKKTTLTGTLPRISIRKVVQETKLL